MAPSLILNSFSFLLWNFLLLQCEQEQQGEEQQGEEHEQVEVVVQVGSNDDSSQKRIWISTQHLPSSFDVLRLRCHECHPSTGSAARSGGDERRAMVKGRREIIVTSPPHSWGLWRTRAYINKTLWLI
jgi:hypothetical protein